MNYDLLFNNKKPVEVALIGIGGFNHSLFVYGSKHPHVRIRVICGRNVEKMVEGYRTVGVHNDEIICPSTYDEALSAFNSGKFLIFTDVELAMRMPIDVMVEGTGSPGASAAHVLYAIANKHHVVNVTKESDSVVGSVLSKKARENGVIYSLAEGDQPSLLLGLLSWARAAGLTPLSVGKASEYDFIYDKNTDTVTVLGDTIHNSGITKTFELVNDTSEMVTKRATICSRFSQKNVPDFTEMQIVCNHVEGLHPDRSRMHTPIATTLEIPDIAMPKSIGGLFGEGLCIDVVNSLRRADEMSLEGGVYAVVACDDEETWRVLKDKGVAVSRNEKAALIYYPAHYLGFEALFSIFSIHYLGLPTSSSEPRPRYDVVGRTTRLIAKGTRLQALGHHHIIDGLQPEIMPAKAIDDLGQLPYFLADNTIARVDIPEGTLISANMLQADGDPILWELRREQDAVFFG